MSFMSAVWSIVSFMSALWSIVSFMSALWSIVSFSDSESPSAHSLICNDSN